MKLLLYELKKVLNKGTLIFLILLMAVNVALGAYHAANSENEDFSGEYADEIDSVIYNAKTNYLMIEDKSDEIAMYQLEIIRYYSNTRDLDVSGEVSGWTAALTNSYPYVSALLASLFLSVLLGCTEFRNDLVVMSYKESRGRICRAKWMVILLSAVGTVFVFVGCALLGASLVTGFEGALRPIQSISEYVYCPYTISALAAVCLRVVATIAVVIAAALLVYNVSLLLKKVVPTICCAAVLFGLDFIFTYVSDGLFDLYGNIGIKNFITDSWLRKFSGLKLLGRFCSQAELLGVVFLLVSFFAIVASYFYFRHFHLIRTVKNKDRKGKAGVRETERSVLFYECKKLLMGRSAVIVVCLFAVHVLFISVTMPNVDSDWNKVYRYYVTKMSDMSYEDQLEEWSHANEKAYGVLSDATLSEQQYFNGEISYEDYLLSRQRAGAAEIELSVLDEIGDQLAALEPLREENIEATLVYAVGWKQLTDHTFSGWILLLTVVLVILPYITTEKESGFSSTVNALFCNDRRKRFLFEGRKMLIMIGFSALIIFVFYIVEIVWINAAVGLPAWSAYAVGAGLQFNSVKIKLWEAVLLSYLGCVLGAIVSAVFARILSKYVQKTVFLIAVFMTVQFVLFSISSIFDVFCAVNVMSYFNGELLHVDGGSVWLQLGILTAIILSVVGLADKKGRKTEKY